MPIAATSTLIRIKHAVDPEELELGRLVPEQDLGFVEHRFEPVLDGAVAEGQTKGIPSKTEAIASSTSGRTMVGGDSWILSQIAFGPRQRPRRSCP